MAKAIFTTKIRPTYDDLPEERYHFPRTYLNQVKGCVGDSIIYYEPRRQDSDDRGRAGRQSYFATAWVKEIVEDNARPDHFYALIQDYLEFTEPVSFRVGEEFFESNLEKNDGSTNRGAFGRAVRILADEEYNKILRVGFGRVLTPEKPIAAGQNAPGFEETIEEFERPIYEHLVRRPFRDAAFARNVAEAYEFTCAFTGLKIINGGGRAEIEAAHIKPVGDNHHGPDSIRNGLGLSRTAHWMFDRGLVSVSDEFQILTSPNLPPDAQRLLNQDGRIRTPTSDFNRPHSRFLQYHRENIFKN